VPAQGTEPTVAANQLNEIVISDAGGADQHGRAGQRKFAGASRPVVGHDHAKKFHAPMLGALGPQAFPSFPSTQKKSVLPRQG
jgi:hypothetical protein